MVIDYWKLDKQTIDDKLPLSNISDILDKLGKCNYFSILDLTNDYHQIEMRNVAIPTTALSTYVGHAFSDVWITFYVDFKMKFV